MIALLAGLALAAPVGVAVPDDLGEARRSRRVAVVIGINEYGSTGLADLAFAEKDAADITAILQDPVLGDFDAVVPLTGAVEQGQIRAVLAQLARGLHRDDLVLIYFAGHGALDLNEGESALVLMTSDSDLDRPAQTGLPMSDLEALIQAIPSRRRVLIVDACHNGAGRSGASDQLWAVLRSLRGDIPPPDLLQIGRMDVRMYAARLNDPAMESEALGNGVYTHYLIQALEGEGDIDGDGVVDVHEAHEWARDRTLRYTDGLQVPWIKVDEEGRVPILLSGNAQQRSAVKSALLTGLESLPTSAVLMVDGQSRGGGALEPGWHDLTVTVDQEVVLDTHVFVRAGERLAIERLLRQRSSTVDLLIGPRVNLALPGTMELLPVPALVGRSMWWPADQGGARLGVGGELEIGRGEVADIGALTSVTTSGSLALSLGQRVAWGPALHGGALWRLDDRQNQSSPLVGAGLYASRSVRSRLVAVDVRLSAPPVQIDGAWNGYAAATVFVGGRRW